MADISKIVGINGVSYDLKDAAARSDIEELRNALTGGVNFIGETTTEITDGSTTSQITINSKTVTAKTGNLVKYGSKEFVFDGARWIELGDLSTLGTLAYKDSATGSFTPSGSVSQPTFTGESMTSTGNFTPSGSVAISVGSGTANYTPQGSVSAPTISVKTAGSTATVNSITDVGTLPSMTMSVADETLTFTFSQGTRPTKGADTTVKTGDAAYEASSPSFTGTGAELKAAFSGSQGSVSVSGTPSGSVSTPSFTGTSGSVSVS